MLKKDVIVDGLKSICLLDDSNRLYAVVVETYIGVMTFYSGSPNKALYCFQNVQDNSTLAKLTKMGFKLE